MFSKNNGRKRKEEWNTQRADEKKDWTNERIKRDPISCMANGKTESEPFENVVMYSEAQKWVCNFERLNAIPFLVDYRMDCCCQLRLCFYGCSIGFLHFGFLLLLWNGCVYVYTSLCPVYFVHAVHITDLSVYQRSIV